VSQTLVIIHGINWTICRISYLPTKYFPSIFQIIVKSELLEDIPETSVVILLQHCGVRSKDVCPIKVLMDGATPMKLHIVACNACSSNSLPKFLQISI